MKLTPGRKQEIDAMSYEALLRKWRNAPAGDAWFQDETGKYWSERMAEMRVKDPSGAVTASKRIGWDG